jgi:hypothetical protein
VAEADLAKLADITSVTYGRVLLVEDIRPYSISLLGETLDVDLVFFADYITTDFQDIKKAPPPPSHALSLSQIAERGYLYVYY